MAKKNEDPATLAVPVAAPAALANMTARPAGLLDDDADVLVVPVAQLLQALSKPVRDRVEGAREGVLWNPVSQSPLPETFVPLRWTHEAILWRSREDGGGIEERSTDLKDPRIAAGLDWAEDGTPPAWTEHLNCVALFEGVASPVVLSWSKTGLKEGKNFYSLCRFAGVPKLWDRAYKWNASERRKAENRWSVLSVRPAGAPPDALRAAAAGIARVILVGDVQTEHSEPLSE